MRPSRDEVIRVGLRLVIVALVAGLLVLLFNPTARSTETVGLSEPSEREVLLGVGRSDGRTVVFVPEVKSGETTGLTLLHLAFHDRLPVDVMRGVLQGYDRRYDRLVDWVTETEGSFDESLLGELPVAELLIGPISDTADHWRR